MIQIFMFFNDVSVLEQKQENVKQEINAKLI